MRQDDVTDRVAARRSNGGEHLAPVRSSVRLGRAFIQDRHALYRRLLVHVDRRNNVRKLAQGEFVAVANLESIYAGAPLVRQIFVYGNSERPSLLAVIVPAPVAVAEYGNSPALKAALHQSLQQTAAAAGLQSYELPVDFILETDPFTDENGLLSGVGKQLRPRLKEHYGERLEQLYSDIAAAQVDEIRVLRETGGGDSVRGLPRPAGHLGR